MKLDFVRGGEKNAILCIGVCSCGWCDYVVLDVSIYRSCESERISKYLVCVCFELRMLVLNVGVIFKVFLMYE